MAGCSPAPEVEVDADRSDQKAIELQASRTKEAQEAQKELNAISNKLLEAVLSRRRIEFMYYPSDKVEAAEAEIARLSALLPGLNALRSSPNRKVAAAARNAVLTTIEDQIRTTELEFSAREAILRNKIHGVRQARQEEEAMIRGEIRIKQKQLNFTGGRGNSENFRLKPDIEAREEQLHNDPTVPVIKKIEMAINTNMENRSRKLIELLDDLRTNTFMDQ